MKFPMFVWVLLLPIVLLVFIPKVTSIYVPNEVDGTFSTLDSKRIPTMMTSLVQMNRTVQMERTNRFRRQSLIPNVKTPYCPPNPVNLSNNRPLLCYQCSGEARQRNSVCDNTLWHFARRTEQYNFRVRCPNDRGFYCVKVIQEKSGIRKTNRGCLGPGPVRVLGGKVVPLNEGCVVYQQNGYITTSCLCRKDLCNSSPPYGLKASKSGLGFVLLGFNLLMQLILD